jgi:hypothetical protein
MLRSRWCPYSEISKRPVFPEVSLSRAEHMTSQAARTNSALMIIQPRQLSPLVERRLLGVGLVFRGRPDESIELKAGALDRKQSRPAQIDPEPPRVDELRHQKDVGQ